MELIKGALRTYYTDAEIVRLCVASISNLFTSSNFSLSHSGLVPTFVDLISSSTDEETRHMCAYMFACEIENDPECKFYFPLLNSKLLTNRLF